MNGRTKRRDMSSDEDWETLSSEFLSLARHNGNEVATRRHMDEIGHGLVDGWQLRRRRVGDGRLLIVEDDGGMGLSRSRIPVSRGSIPGGLL